MTKAGERTTPPVWQMNCLEQVCGICTMVINGRVRQSCSALIDNLEQPIKLEPMSKFPNVRDLVVDRSQMFDHLRRCTRGSSWTELTISGRDREWTRTTCRSVMLTRAV